MPEVDDELLQETERIRRGLKAAAETLDEFVSQLAELTAQLRHDTRGGRGDDNAAASAG